MEQIILVVHLLVALVIIGLILLLQGNGADMGAYLGWPEADSVRPKGFRAI